EGLPAGGFSAAKVVGSAGRVEQGFHLRLVSTRERSPGSLLEAGGSRVTARISSREPAPMRIALLLLCLLASTATRAQAPHASDAPLDKLSRLVLEPGKPVRIMREDVRLEGLVLETNGRFLTLGTGAIE